jgi:predicted molibdopterin-dependent oxidoreductase YjgC
LRPQLRLVVTGRASPTERVYKTVVSLFFVSNLFIVSKLIALMETIKFSVDGKEFESEANLSVFEACRRNGVYIPTLCHHPRLPVHGKCKVCIVEVENSADFPFVTSCSTPIEDGMVISTNNAAVKGKSNAAIRAVLSQPQSAYVICL